MLVGRGKTRQVGRVHNQDGVELEADRPRLNIADASQENRRQKVLVCQPLFDSRGDFFQHALARSIFQKPHQRLDIVAIADLVRIELRLGG